MFNTDGLVFVWYGQAMSDLAWYGVITLAVCAVLQVVFVPADLTDAAMIVVYVVAFSALCYGARPRRLRLRPALRSRA